VTVFITVLAGTSVFVLGQIVLKFVIEPIISFKEAIGGISYLILVHQGSPYRYG
jgi:hypothetical protein